MAAAESGGRADRPRGVAAWAGARKMGVPRPSPADGSPHGRPGLGLRPRSPCLSGASATPRLVRQTPPPPTLPARQSWLIARSAVSLTCRGARPRSTPQCLRCAPPRPWPPGLQFDGADRTFLKFSAEPRAGYFLSNATRRGPVGGASANPGPRAAKAPPPARREGGRESMRIKAPSF